MRQLVISEQFGSGDFDREYWHINVESERLRTGVMGEKTNRNECKTASC
jgi:hypothetical protein